MYGEINPVLDIDKLRASLIQHEGKRNKPYTDTVGKLTIGVGRNLSDRGLSDAEISVLLENDIQDAITAAESLDCWPNVSGNDARARAIVELVFNLGKPKLLNFIHAMGYLRANNFSAAADEFLNSRWAQQTGQRAKTIAAMIRDG